MDNEIDTDEQPAADDDHPQKPDTAEFVPLPSVSVLDEVRDPDFQLVRRGYDPRAVDAYVGRVAHLVEELKLATSPQLAVEHALSDLGEQTTAILRQAQETASEMTSRSESQARERLDRAELEATRMRTQAEIQVRRLDADADRIWEERQRLVQDTRRLADSILRVADEADERLPPEAEERFPRASEEEGFPRVSEEETSSEPFDGFASGSEDKTTSSEAVNGDRGLAAAGQ